MLTAHNVTVSPANSNVKGLPTSLLSLTTSFWRFIIELIVYLQKLFILCHLWPCSLTSIHQELWLWCVQHSCQFADSVHLASIFNLNNYFFPESFQKVKYLSFWLHCDVSSPARKTYGTYVHNEVRKKRTLLF